MTWINLDWPHFRLNWLFSIAVTSSYSVLFADIDTVLFLVAVAPSSSSNADFGEWNAFPGGQMPASAQPVDNSGNDLFGAMTAGPATGPALAPVSAPGSGPASTDLFDLMGPTQSLTSSQSLNFSMSSTQSVSSTVLPQSRSQVCMIALKCTHRDLMIY